MCGIVNVLFLMELFCGYAKACSAETRVDPSRINIILMATCNSWAKLSTLDEGSWLQVTRYIRSSQISINSFELEVGILH